MLKLSLGRRCIVPACAFLISCDLRPGDLAAISMQKHTATTTTTTPMPVLVPLELTSEQLCIPRVPLHRYVNAYLHSHKGGLVTSAHSLLWIYKPLSLLIMSSLAFLSVALFPSSCSLPFIQHLYSFQTGTFQLTHFVCSYLCSYLAIMEQCLKIKLASLSITIALPSLILSPGKVRICEPLHVSLALLLHFPSLPVLTSWPLFFACSLSLHFPLCCISTFASFTWWKQVFFLKHLLSFLLLSPPLPPLSVLGKEWKVKALNVVCSPACFAQTLAPTTCLRGSPIPQQPPPHRHLRALEENENESGFNGRVVDSSVDETVQSAALWTADMCSSLWEEMKHFMRVKRCREDRDYLSQK